jgi:phosphate transport system substrate-binding protein
LGYFSYSYYQQNQDKHPAFAIDNGESGVFISTETMEKNKHQPLSQPLFVYVFLKKTQYNWTLEEFIKFYREQVP